MTGARRYSLEAIAKIENPQNRGFKFQEFLKDLLSYSRFEVTSNPGTARPRQSDLFAARDDKEFLIEAKWQSKKITTADIEDLRARLRHAHAGLIGCIFSMSEYAPTAIAAVEANRNTLILLFTPKEIRDLDQRSVGVDELIKLKRQALVIHGRCWFSHQPSKLKLSERLALPKTTRTIIENKKITRYFSNPNSDTHDFVFASTIPDIRWNTLGGDGVGINISVPVQTVAELKDFFGLLHNQLKLSSEGSFSIRQLQCSWHGYGISNLLAAIGDWKKRYQSANLSYIHHSEDIHYFDACNSGHCLLSLRQRVNHPTDYPLDSCELEIHLAGLPVNLQPFQRICEEAGFNNQFFVPFKGKKLDEIRLKSPICVQPVGQIISTYNDDEQIVCGLIIKNPFKDEKLIPAGQLEYSPFSALGTTDLLICELSDWHGVEDKMDQYRMTRIEAMHVNQAIVCRCVGTWDRMVNRAQPTKMASPPAALPALFPKKRIKA